LLQTSKEKNTPSLVGKYEEGKIKEGKIQKTKMNIGKTKGK
jgi:hypothetical protein